MLEALGKVSDTMQDDLQPARQHFSQETGQINDVDLMSLAATIWRGKYVIAFCMTAALLLSGWYGLRVATPLFAASTQMSLLVRTESVADIDQILTGATPDQTTINTEMEVIRSRDLLGRLVDDLNLTADPEFSPALSGPSPISRAKSYIKGLIGRPVDPEQAVQSNRDTTINLLRTAIRATSQEQSYIFTIDVTTTDPMKSALIANTLAQYYRDDQIAQKVEASEAAAIWLSQRVAELQVDIEAAESQINALRSRNALISDEAIAALSAQSVEVGRDLQAAELALSRAEDRLAEFESAEDTDFLRRAEVSEDAQLLAIAEAAAGGDAAAVLRFERRTRQIVLQLSGDVERAREAVSELSEQVETITARFARQSQALIEIEQIERDTEATRLLYETFLTRLKETTVQIGVHQADSRILSLAIPGNQVAPNATMLMALSLVLGLVVGTAIVIIRAALQNTVRDAKELERQSGLSVLGEIPRIPGRTRAATIAYLSDKPSSAAAEAIRNLRTSILMSNLDRPPQVIVSTSSLPGEGKTTMAIAMAQNLAGLDKKVILLEGDIRRRKFADYFPQAGTHAGIIAVLSGATSLSEAVWSHPTMSIDVLMGERSKANAGDILSSSKFRQLIEELRETYDYVVIDTPPVLVVPDARIVSKSADAVIYSVRWNSTTHTQIEEGLKQFRTANVPITGLVLSQVDGRAMNRYGAYRGYGRGYYER